MPEDKFKKEHMYNIRHSYGKEGKRVNYTPASCMSVINSQPGEVRQFQYMQSFPFASADGVPLQMSEGALWQAARAIGWILHKLLCMLTSA